MASAIFDVIAETQIARGVPLGPSSLGWKIDLLIKKTTLFSSHDGYYSSTIILNAAFLELVSQQMSTEEIALLETWASHFITTRYGACDLNPGDHLAVLNALVDFIELGLKDLQRLGEENERFEQVEAFSRDRHGILLLVHEMRITTWRTLTVAALGRPLTDEEELVLLMSQAI